MKIATWNINSVRARLERLLSWLQKVQPDVLCLQETKVTDDKFPYEPIREAGYYATVHGQKTYNGVAILSRSEAGHVWRGMGDGVQDPPARFLAAEVGGVHVVSMYVPNGQVVGTEPYAYKLQWLQRVRAFLDRHFTPATPLVLCGDLNIARDEKDVARPDVWAGRGGVRCWRSPCDAPERLRTAGCGKGVAAKWRPQSAAIQRGPGIMGLQQRLSCYPPRARRHRLDQPQSNPTKHRGRRQS